MSRLLAPVEIRDARAGDAAALSTLLGELGYPTAPGTAAQRLEALQSAGETVLVALRGGEVRGVLALHVTFLLHLARPVGRLTALVVHSGERGAGIGRSLVEAGEGRLLAKGCDTVEVTSNLQRSQAHAFYRRLGYDATSVRFRKPLAAAGGAGEDGPQA